MGAFRPAPRPARAAKTAFSPSGRSAGTAWNADLWRGAQWDEIDLEAWEWRIPPERMKTGREHRVPLSRAALAVLHEVCALADGSGPVFPSARGGPLSKLVTAKMVRDLGIGVVPYGFRSSFRDWAAECSDAPREVCELALTHVNTNSIEAAYRRSDLFERRRALMEKWARFLVESEPDSAVSRPIAIRVIPARKRHTLH